MTHEDIIEHVAYERGKTAGQSHSHATTDGEDYFHTGTKRDIKYRAREYAMDEEDMSDLKVMNKLTQELDHVLLQLEELLYMIGDQPESPTEDELMNYVIGLIESVKVKKNKVKVASKL